MTIKSKQEIMDYLLFEQYSRYQRSLYKGAIKPKTPNITEDASESLTCHLIKDGSILKQLHPITKLERKGRNGKDIVVNGYHKLEVKGTSSNDGSITTSESNFESFAWVWMDFRPFFEHSHFVVPVHVITNPRACITSERYVQALKQNKLNLPSVIGDAVNSGNYERYELNLKTMLVLSDPSRQWVDFK